MVDKSPRASLSKKSAVSIKQKRAAKKAEAEAPSGVERLTRTTSKRH
jgi:hypothetical protein